MAPLKSSKLILLLASLSLVVLIILIGACEASSPTKRGREGENDEHHNDDEVTNKVRLPRVLDFEEYAMRFHKAYETTEWMSKAKLFIARVIKIFHHNARFLQQKYNYFLGLNEFTDISANDFKAMSSKGDPALESVQETRHYPANMPASELPSVQQLTGAEGFSMAPAGDDDSDEREPNATRAIFEARYGGVRQTGELDFFEDDAKDDIDFKAFARQFKKTVDSEEAERVSKVIDLNRKLEAEQAEALRVSDPKSERAMAKQKIKYKPVVNSNNKNYDESLMVSQGVYDNMQAGRAFSDKMAAFLDYDVDIMSDVKPYEPPSKRTRTKSLVAPPSDGVDDGDDDDEENAGRSGYLSSFFLGIKTAAKSVASFLIDDDELLEYRGDDDDDDDGVIVNEATVDKIDAKTKKQNELNMKRIKYAVDWRVTGCITRAKSQASCNACYAFTVVALMEYLHCRQTKELTEFSAQYIVDCGRRLDKLNGCRGGYLGMVGKFVDQFGLELQAFYPYSGSDGQCPYQPSESAKMGYLKPKITSWAYVKSMADWYKHVRVSPILVGIAMPADFLAYAGGIHDGANCNVDQVHAMMLVGSGSQGGKEFWLLKNSFSADWGENGYFRLAKDAPLKCFNTGVVVRADFKQGLVKNPDHEQPVLVS